MALLKLSFHFDVLIEVDFYSQPVLEPIKKLPKIDFSVIEIEESFIAHIFFYGKPEVYTIFILFYVGGLDNDATLKY